MRQIIILFGLIILTGFTPAQTDTILTKKSAETIVTNFMSTMVAGFAMPDNQKTSDALKKFILPADLEKYQGQKEWVGINTYCAGDFKIIKTDLPFVTVKFKGPKLVAQKRPHWERKLTFKITEFQGQVYIVPSGVDNNYVNAWWTTEKI